MKRLLSFLVLAATPLAALGSLGAANASRPIEEPITVILSVPDGNTPAEYVRSCTVEPGKWCLSNLVLNGRSTRIVEAKSVCAVLRASCFVSADGSPIAANYVFQSDGGRVACTHNNGSASCAYMTGRLSWVPRTVAPDTEPTDPIMSISFSLSGTDSSFTSGIGLVLANAPVKSFVPSSAQQPAASFELGRPESRTGGRDADGRLKSSSQCGWLMFYGIENCEPAHRVDTVNRSLSFFLFPSASVPDPASSGKPLVLEDGAGTHISTNAQGVGIPSTNGVTGVYALQLIGPHFACGYEDSNRTQCNDLIAPPPGLSTALWTCPPTCPPKTDADFPWVWVNEPTSLNKAYIEWYWPSGFLKRNFGLDPSAASNETLIIERTVKKTANLMRSRYTPLEKGLLVRSDDITFSAPVVSVRRQLVVSRTSTLHTSRLRALLGQALIPKSSTVRFGGSSNKSVSIARDRSSLTFLKTGAADVRIVVDQGRGRKNTVLVRLKIR